jgi:hypothetical protein
MENLDAIECGVVGVFIAPTTKNGRWKAVVAWRTGQSGAPTTSADRWGSTVGVLTCGASGLSGGAPDRSCRLSGAPTARALSSARRRALNALQSTVAREVVVAPLAHRTLSGASPDSPVNYSGVASHFPEGEEFSVECPGAPNIVRCARPGCLLGCLLLSLFEPFLGLFIGLL